MWELNDITKVISVGRIMILSGDLRSIISTGKRATGLGCVLWFGTLHGGRNRVGGGREAPSLHSLTGGRVPSPPKIKLTPCRERKFRKANRTISQLGLICVAVMSQCDSKYTVTVSTGEVLNNFELLTTSCSQVNSPVFQFRSNSEVHWTMTSIFYSDQSHMTF